MQRRVALLRRSPIQSFSLRIWADCPDHPLSDARQDMALLEQVLADTEHLSDSPRQRLLEFVQWFVDAFSGLEKPHEGCLYTSYLYEPEQFDQEVKDMVSEAILNGARAWVK